MVRAKGLEPPHLSILEPKSSASTNSATPARTLEGAGAYNRRAAWATRIGPQPAHSCCVRQRRTDRCSNRLNRPGAARHAEPQPHRNRPAEPRASRGTRQHARTSTCPRPPRREPSRRRRRSRRSASAPRAVRSRQRRPGSGRRPSPAATGNADHAASVGMMSVVSTGARWCIRRRAGAPEQDRHAAVIIPGLAVRRDVAAWCRRSA